MITCQLLKKYPVISDQVSRQELEIILGYLENRIQTQKSFSVVEFGCYTGTTSLFIMRMLMHYQCTRVFHVYDSFEGLPPKAPEDISPAGEQFVEGELHATKKQFIAQFKKTGLPLPIIHKGWFGDLTDEVIPPNIGFAFLDGDYYHSIKESFKHITSKLTNDAVIIVDDYNSVALPGVSIATNEWRQERSHQFRVINSLGVIIAG